MGHQVRVKLLVLDLDGTALQEDGSLSMELIEAVTRIQQAGVQVMLATGRMMRSAIPYWMQLSLGTGPLIAYNGSMVAEMPSERSWFSWHLNSDVARLVVSRALDSDILTQVYVGNELWLSREDERAQNYIAVNHIPGEVKIGRDILRWPAPPIKILLQDNPERLDRFREDITPEVLGLQGRLFKSQEDYLEIVPAGVGKGPALAKVAERLGIGAPEIMAIGDAENDIDMLRFAGIGVAMGQASELVKSSARHVTKPVQDNGAAYAIHRWILND